MNITYLLDNELTFIKPVEQGLRKHNATFTSGIPSGSLKLYIVHDHDVKACIECNHFWGWIEVDKMYYENDEALKILFNEVYRHYGGRQHAIYYKTHDRKRLNALKKIGFQTVGKIEDRPSTFTTEELVDYTMSFSEANHEYEIVLGSNESDPFKDQFDRLTKAYAKSINYSDAFDEVFYAAFDQDKVIGGVYGELSSNYLYVECQHFVRQYS